ncbi:MULTISPECIES: RNA polymerase sigma factor [Bacillaceae]|uniref:RNA polymerase sigma factor n=1 Tax=Bacillaceae TaxID=186817 RepID=UPI0006AED04C|nr:MULTISPECIES: sigma-70 family RNA polymerase sigma factor [Bacillaceae]ALC84399.1 RNA polymerase subunit sigma [Bacillus sp. FJAT-22090]KQL33200.1 RNA polymerase subunit sigma [Psychrobacillus sp. FJAT-21963]
MEKHLIEEWFELYEKDVTSYLIYYTGSIDVEDLVQETFLRAMKKMTVYKKNGHPKTWLVSIARNMVIDQYRKSNVWNKIRHLFIKEQDILINMEQNIMINQDNSVLYHTINQLPAHYKEIIILKGIMEMSSKEVGLVIRSNENNVNVLYHRSLKKLKELLEKEGFEHGRI